MAVDFEEVIDRYIQYWETLSPETVEKLRSLAEPDVHFRDPFNEVRDIDLMVKIIAETFEVADDARFKILSKFVNGSVAMLKWEMSFVPKRLKRKTVWKVAGVSEIRFSSEGKLVEHLDYWDAAAGFYEKLPLLGWILRKIKRKIQVT